MPETYSRPPRSLADATDPREFVRFGQIDPKVLHAQPAIAVRSTQASLTAAAGDLIVANCGNNAVTVTPPSNPADGDQVSLLKVDDSVNKLIWNGPTHADATCEFVGRWSGATLVWIAALSCWALWSVNTSGSAAPVTPASIGAVSESRFRSVLFGAEAYGGPLSCEAILTTTYTSLPSGDYLMSGNMTVPNGADPYGMLIQPGGSFSFYRVLLPLTGRYDVEWFWFSSATTGVAAGKVALNVPSGSSANNATVNYSCMTATSNPAAEGTPVAIRRSMMFNANDVLSFLVYSSVTFSMPLNKFGLINTSFLVTYRSAY